MVRLSFLIFRKGLSLAYSGALIAEWASSAKNFIELSIHGTAYLDFHGSMIFCLAFPQPNEIAERTHGKLKS
jgi:hypothetical protein